MTFFLFGRDLPKTCNRPYIHDFIRFRVEIIRVSEVLNLYKQGCSINDIARLMGKSRHKVRAILHRSGALDRLSVDDPNVTAWRKRRHTHAHPPYGFTYYLGKLVIEPREHETLLLVEHLAKEGMNPNVIAEYLNTKELKPRRAKKWNRNSIVLILSRMAKPD